MKISKEVWLVIALVGFLVAYLIDRIAGPVAISVGNPIAFLRSTTLLNKYPFTATAILVRTLAIFVSSMLVTSIVDGKYFAKAITLLLVGILAEFFAIQQLATGFRITTIQWTLSIAYGSLLLSLGVISMVLKGIWSSFNEGKDQPVSTTEAEDNGPDKTILEP